MGILLKDQRVLYASENIGKINIDVDPTQPARVDITPSSGTLAATAGATVQLAATVLPQTAIDKSVTWSSSDTSVATVNNNGLVTRTAPLTSDDGQPHSVTITATAVNGVMGSVTLQAAVLQLPANAFAVYDGIVGARERTTQWRDMSGNGLDMTIVDANESPNYWSLSDCLFCDCRNHSTSAIISGNTSFVAGKGFSLSALVQYDVEASEFYRMSGDASYTTQGLDILFGIHSSPKTLQIGVGSRKQTSYSDAHPRQLFLAHRETTDGGYHRHYTNAVQATTLSGARLITWVLYADNGTWKCNVYVDGGEPFATLPITSDVLDNVLVGVSPIDISFFASSAIATSTSSNVYNFFGNVYGISLYNRVLTTTEITAIKNYYLERYSNYYTAQ